MVFKGLRGKVLEKVPMRRYTSMRVGGPVRYLVYPADEADLSGLLKALRRDGTPYRFLGNGTNVVVSDRGLDEAVIRLCHMRALRYTRAKDRTFLDVSAGVPLKWLIEQNARRGLSGLERLYWIPGTVGGAVKMNAGSFGASVSEVLDGVRLIDEQGERRSRGLGEMAFGYRSSSIGARDCVVEARFLLRHKPEAEIRADMTQVYEERRKRHPMEYPSAGSVFKSENGKPAWKFIEEAGLKGMQIGGAQVSEKHGNFVINRGGARAADVKALVDRVKAGVYERLGVALREEVEFWGFDE